VREERALEGAQGDLAAGLRERGLGGGLRIGRKSPKRKASDEGGTRVRGAEWVAAETSRAAQITATDQHG
jgi:hypothetical protein